MSSTCPVCKQPASERPLENWSGTRVECARCGSYRVFDGVDQQIGDGRGEQERHIVSGALRQAHDRGLRTDIRSPKDLDAFVAGANPPASPVEALDRLLVYVQQYQSRADEFCKITPDDDYPIAFCHDADELRHLLSNLTKLGFTEMTPARGASDLSLCRLTMDGWRRALELAKTQVDSSQAFVAMSFHESLDAARDEGFVPALKATGFDPVVVMNLVEHTGKIDDQIIAQIRRSGIVVADFTGQRQSVYFEAGFALGLGRQVIWTCRADSVSDLHFDTRQYNHIAWKDPDELREKLINRVEAVVPGHMRPGR